MAIWKSLKRMAFWKNFKRMAFWKKSRDKTTNRPNREAEVTAHGDDGDGDAGVRNLHTEERRPEEHYGLFPLSPNDLSQPPSSGSYALDIVAVHGLGGHYKETWTAENGKLWLRDFLPEQLLEAGLECRIMSYGYNSNTAFSKAVTDIGDEAAILLKGLDGVRETVEEQQRPILFIAHSLGGILVKKAIITAHERSEKYSQLLRSIQSLVFFGTPHRGSDIAYWGDFAAQVLNTVQLGLGTNRAFVEPLKRNSKEFAEITKSFVPRLNQFNIQTFYETERFHGQLIVDKDSSCLNVPNEDCAGIAGTNHCTMCKMDYASSQQYKFVWMALKALLRQATRDRATLILTAEFFAKPEFPSVDKRAQPQSPRSIEQDLNKPEFHESLEWLLDDPKYRNWRDSQSSSFLWLCGPPKSGKTVAASYARQDLVQQQLRNRDVSSAFCNGKDSEVGILATLSSQLINGSQERSQNFRVEIPNPFQNQNLSNSERERSLQKALLTESVTAALGRETVLIIDGIDSLSTEIRASLLSSLLDLEETLPDTVILRILISSSPYEDIATTLCNRVTIEKHKEWRECLATLFFQEWNAREIQIKSKNATVEWIRSNGDYNSWTQTPDSALLWIQGKPGSGKSTVTKFIMNHLRQESGVERRPGPQGILEHQHNFDPPKCPIFAEFYYNFRGGPTERSHEFMLRSILHQVLGQNPRLFPLVREIYEHVKRVDVQQKERNSPWRLDDLKSALEKIRLAKFKVTIFLAIDGIDESYNDDMRDVLNFLAKLPGHTPESTPENTLKILLSSRPEPDILICLQKVPLIVLQKLNSDDIRKYVVQRFQAIQDITETHVDLWIKDYIITNADGVFLWVALVMAEIQIIIENGGYTPEELKEEIRKLPKELGGPKGIYKRIVESLSTRPKADDRTMEKARRVLAWVSFRERPVRLSELEHCLAIPSYSVPMNISGYDFDGHKPRDIERGIRSWCGGLVEISDTNDKCVELIHRTLRDFLLDPQHIAQPYDLTQWFGDFEIASTCCRYIYFAFSTEILLKSVDLASKTASEVSNHLDSHHLLIYALKYLSEHLQHLGNDSKKFRDEIMRIPALHGRKQGCYAYLLLVQWIAELDEAPAPVPSVYQSANLCLQSLFIDSARMGRLAATHVYLILGARLDDSLDGLDDRETFCENALQAASRCGHMHVVQLLLNSGAEINREGSWHGNAVQAASAGGHESIVRFLIDNGANIHARCGWHGSALHAALATGHESIVRLLIEAGSDIKASGCGYAYALEDASSRGHESIVRLLLEKGAATSSHGRPEWTWYGDALHIASANGHKPIVRLLIENGFGVKESPGWYGSAIGAAAAEGHESIVQLLIEEDAVGRADQGETSCTNALPIASAGGHISVVKMLIDNGAEVNAENKWYGSAIQAASLEGHVAVVRLLVDRGANIHARGSRYGNAIQAALIGGHEDIAQLLIGKGLHDDNENEPCRQGTQTEDGRLIGASVHDVFTVSRATLFNDPYFTRRWKYVNDSVFGNEPEWTGEMVDLEAAISRAEFAAAAESEDSHEWANTQYQLGALFRTHYQETRNMDDLKKALNCFQKSSQCQNAIPLLRIRSSRHAIQILQAFRDWEQANHVAQVGLDLIPLVCGSYLKGQDQERVLSEASWLTSEASSLSIRTGHIDRALQQLEVGRGTIMRHLLNNRCNSSEQDRKQASLPEGYEILPDQNIRRIKPLNPEIESQPDDDCEKRILQELDSEQSLLPMSMDELKQCSNDGPVVIVNVSYISADAIIVSKFGIKAIPLPKMSFAVKAISERDSPRCQSTANRSPHRAVRKPNERPEIDLSLLWFTCVQPIIQNLEACNLLVNSDMTPRVWWIGAGMASSLPFHIAGHYGTEPSNTCLGRVISSYMPTVRALKQAKMRASIRMKHRRHQKSMLFISGLGLPAVQREKEAIEKSISGAYSFRTLECPSPHHVLDSLGDSEILHFSCFGEPDTKNPLEISLVMEMRSTEPATKSDQLTVSDILDANVQPQAWISFLSACGTGGGYFDHRGLSLSSAFQVSGFPHVIGVVGDVDDDVCCEVSCHFYRYLAGNSDRTHESRMVAEALRYAILQTRLIKPEMILRLAPFVHFGP